ncbi:CRISPR-associated Cas6 family protein [Sphingobacterium allocomposti]|uniref:CRISPR-associated endoribonuclease n=1 Tax=Sphingobacterium allocomposti TaxID=415956 RepID=A0A5S5CVC8_9SPHI|nr:CRISPR-associated endoribonuclease Cas6 [Sphingobacterium composti Yoo et al. 2007 non Ten et al. 2007]TYP87740.1 CRISPR-associated Cas6 family protein [Sphingobacterium composti Yoo et al. 2007 non Ten et al. 2007]
MRFKITTEALKPGSKIPINYQYPLSSAVYRIIAKGNDKYASFLHDEGYGRGFKFFTFSQLNVPFRIEGDRLRLTRPEMSFEVAFHIPEAMESFIKGLFRAEQIDVADQKSKASFTVKAVETLASPLSIYKEKEIVAKQLKPLSPIVAGIPNDKGYDDYLKPDDPLFVENLIYNWRSKISDCYDKATAAEALLMMEILPMKQPFKSRLITIKDGTPEETKIRGWMNFGLKVTAEKRFVELLMNAGAGLYNAQGFGCVGV